METKEIINTATFLLEEPLFECCWVCGDKQYNQFFVEQMPFRVCSKCLKTNKNGVTTLLNRKQRKALNSLPTLKGRVSLEAN